MKFRIYIEGGGNTGTEGTQFRRSWSAFFKNAGLTGSLPSVVRCGGRESAFDRFRTAVVHPKNGEVPLLLVDSEDPVRAGHSAWEHLYVRDKWMRPAGAGDDQAFLMVQVMEAWFFADRETLERFFGQGFKANKIPKWPNLEDVLKETILQTLEQATRDCKAHYRKGKRSFALLERMNPGKIAAACPRARELLDRLQAG